MERIKKALERARAERNGQPQITSVSEGQTVIQPIAQSAQDVAYTQTRNIKVSQRQLRASRLVTGFAPCAFTDSYKMLRTQVLQQLNENNWNVLAVTSPGVGEGKTLTALNLAASIAMEIEHTVLLVGANLRHPSLHEHLDFPEGGGLSDYLLHDTPISELLIHPAGIDHLTVLPGGKPILNSAEMLNSPKMGLLVDEMKQRYKSRIVIFDLPPVLSAADASAFAPYVDAVLLVIEDGKTTKQDTKHAMELLSGTPILGTVLNRAGAG